jgi:prevent-host-death family protein
MKSVDVNELQANLGQYLDGVEEEAIVVTRDGRPCAVLHGVQDDLESAELARSPEFWTMIEERRRQPTIPWEEAKRQLKND